MTAKQLARSRERLSSFLAEMLAGLGRKDRQRWGGVYLRGLLLDGERKSAGAMAERLPDGNEQSLQQFVSQSPWAWEPLWRQMAERIECVFSPAVAWIVDDTGFPKKGEHSVGVARQYSGTLGKTANGQIAVSLHRSDGRGSSPLGFQLYLPKEWTEDAERCRAAGVPAGIAFQPNWRLALELIDKALAWGLEKPPAVLADSAYGEVTAFREELEQRGLAYAVGISKALAVWPEPPGGAIPAWHRRANTAHPVCALRRPETRVGQSPGPGAREALSEGDLARGQSREAGFTFLGHARPDGPCLESRQGAQQRGVALGGVVGG
jgi:SRSO17 transposase